tara:strand:- start:6295 stop:7044 length:750 start_codon:yes stop_codon:yes gene_type:complete
LIKKRIDQILVEKKLVENRSKAQAMIMAGQVYINNKLITKSGEKFNQNINIKLKDLNPKWVSRGAYKLIHALDYFEIDVKNMICLDLGASTGGFSQVLLKRGAKKIFSVDVGTNQLHEKLKKEKKIISIEKTNAKFLSKSLINQKVDIIVCDVSFISMKKVLDPSFKFLNENSKIIGLIKPQFEAKKNELKKGIVKDNSVHKRICNIYINWFKEDENFEYIGLVESPIQGPKGNREFLIYTNYYKNLKQ